MHNKVLKYLVLLAIVLLIISIGSFWFSEPSFSEKDVVLELEGPTQASAGDEITYKLKYANQTRTILEDLNFTFNYPDNATKVVNGSAGSDDTESFEIKKLSSGEKGEREFSFFILGEKGNIKVGKATLSFKVGNLRSVFEKTVSVSTTIVDTPISLTIVAPPNIISGQAVDYILDYRNQTGEDISELVLEFDYPDGYEFQFFEPQPDIGANVWKIPILKRGGGSRITIRGFLEGREGENKLVKVKLKRKIGSDYVDYQEVSAVTLISNPVLGLEVLANKLSDYAASLGDRLEYTINYSNNSNRNFMGMRLELRLEGEMYDLSTLDTRGGFFDSSNNTIIWDASVIPEFSVFAPRQEGKITFGLKLKSFFPSGISGTSRDRFVKATAKFLSAGFAGGDQSGEAMTTTSIITKIGTQPTLNTFAYYADADLGSTGPMPPRVGEETFFTIRWQLTNPGNNIDNARVVAKLPSGVQWGDGAKAGNGQKAPEFNANTNEVVWDIGLVPYGVGLSGAKYEGIFRVKIRPTSSQSGSNIGILGESRLEGRDNFTKQSIVVTNSGLYSDGTVDRPKEGRVE